MEYGIRVGFRSPVHPDGVDNLKADAIVAISECALDYVDKILKWVRALDLMTSENFLGVSQDADGCERTQRDIEAG